MVLAMATSGSFAAGNALQTKMDTVFGSMSNVTKPGVFETQRRGVLSGGSVYVRNPVMNTQLINFQPPSWNASCGGIDFFGGSFSFINADQFVQLLRTVAANAKGYAFQMALDIACEQCMTWINNLQSKIQQLNSALGNSCQLAQGLVSDIRSGIDSNYHSKYSAIGTVKGLYTDWFGASSNTDGKKTNEEVHNNMPEAEENLVGNIVWQSLKNGNAKSWVVAGAAGDKDEYSLLMSFSGTVIIDPPAADKDGKGNSNKPNYFPPKLGFKQLIEGGTVPVYTCNDEDKCMSPTDGTLTIVGLQKKIEEVLLGTDASVGVITKFGMMADNAFTAQEAAVMSNMPAAAGAMIRNLSTNSQTVAREQAPDMAYAVAMAMANDYITQQLDAVKHAIRNSQNTYADQVIKQVDAAKQQLTNDYNAYAKEHPTVAALTSQYNEVIKNIQTIWMTAQKSTAQPTMGER